MKRVFRLAIIGFLAFCTATFFIQPDASIGKKRTERVKRAKHRKKHRKDRKYYYHRRRYPYRHRRYRYWPQYYYHFAYPIYPGWYYPGFYRYYPYHTYESVLVYREDPALYGLLRLDIRPPETEIFIDGKFLGTGEHLRERATSLKIGEHRLQLKLGGYSSFYPIHITPDRISTFSKDVSAE